MARHKINFFLKAEFTENGTTTTFEIDGVQIKVVTVSTGDRRSGLHHALIINDEEVSPAMA
jgi:hypothetical protein